jgi:hypothetical protein
VYGYGWSPFLNIVATECGYTGGVCDADFGIYQHNYPDGKILNYNLPAYIFTNGAGDSFGPPIGTFVCKSGTITFTTCGNVTRRNFTSTYLVPGGGILTLRHAWEGNFGCQLGDSGGETWEPFGGNTARIWGMVYGFGSTACGSNTAYWFSLTSGTAILISNP